MLIETKHGTMFKRIGELNDELIRFARLKNLKDSIYYSIY